MKNIVVLGGGTAGWIAALMARHYYPYENIIVVESDDIGILGAGEGTTTQFISFFLDVVGIPISDLVRECGATIKNGIRYTNWNGDGESYFHGFIPTDQLSHHTNYIINKQIVDGLPVNDIHFLNTLSSLKKVAFTYRPNQYSSFENPIRSFNDHSSWALHFDARNLANYLRKVATTNRGITRIEGRVTSIIPGNDGMIDKLVLEDNSTIDVNFMFDCSGFARLAIGKHYNTEWISYSDYLPMKAAVPFFMDHDNDVNPETEAIAMKYGWIWKIPVRDRYGCGYVFDSDYINGDQALAEAEEYFGRKLVSPTTFKFSPGTYRETLVKNCMAVGLAQSFVEPLEATSIWVSIINLNNFLKANGINNGSLAYKNKFNKECLKRNQEVMEFIALHYMSKRNDSSFWCEFTQKNKVPSSVTETIELLQDNIYLDLSDKILFPRDSWVSIGAGLGILNSNNCKKHIFNLDLHHTDLVIKSHIKNMNNMIKQSISHKDFLKYLNEH